VLVALRNKRSKTELAMAYSINITLPAAWLDHA
jgi:hypothetical protein